MGNARGVLPDWSELADERVVGLERRIPCLLQQWERPRGSFSPSIERVVITVIILGSLEKTEQDSFGHTCFILPAQDTLLQC